jgi:hypothetical protein
MVEFNDDCCSNETHMGIVLGEVEVVKNSSPSGLLLTHQSMDNSTKISLGHHWNLDVFIRPKSKA